MPIIAAVIGVVLLGSFTAYAILGPEDGPLRKVDVAELIISSFIDGTYSQTVSYVVPNNHTEPMTVTITVEDNIITGTELEFTATNEVSEKYQKRFTDWHTPEVVGKPLAEVSLVRLGGASLTSVAFNEALRDIKQQAQE
jgi:hypothetical protein